MFDVQRSLCGEEDCELVCAGASAETADELEALSDRVEDALKKKKGGKEAAAAMVYICKYIYIYIYVCVYVYIEIYRSIDIDMYIYTRVEDALTKKKGGKEMAAALVRATSG